MEANRTPIYVKLPLAKPFRAKSRDGGDFLTFEAITVDVAPLVLPLLERLLIERGGARLFGALPAEKAAERLRAVFLPPLPQLVPACAGLEGHGSCEGADAPEEVSKDGRVVAHLCPRHAVCFAREVVARGEVGWEIGTPRATRPLESLVLVVPAPEAGP